MEDSSSVSSMNGNSNQNLNVHNFSNPIQPNTTVDSYINGISIELSPKKSDQYESEFSPLINYLNTATIAGLDQLKDKEHNLFKTGKCTNSGRKKIPTSLRRSASTVSDIQFMRRGKEDFYLFSNSYLHMI